MSVDTLQMDDEEFSRHMEGVDVNSESNIEDTEVTDNETVKTETTEENDDSIPETEETEVEEDTNTQSQDDKIANESESTDDTDGADATDPETTEIDYKAFYETVTKDYKAAGKTLPGVKDPEKFIKALQMSTDYALKTTALKPALKRVKMLDGISDDDLAEMLDFKNRDPEVIKKALKEAQIDPMDLDLDEINYATKHKVMSDSEYDFKETLDELRVDPEFSTTSRIILEEWDEDSKAKALDNTNVLKALHWEVKTGRYEEINKIVIQRKSLGENVGKTDLDMFIEIATQMDAQGRQGVSSQKTEKKEDPALEAKRLQAGISTRISSNPSKKYDPTRLSDDEFMKLLDDGASFI